MRLVVPVGDRLEEALVARGAADVFGRSAARAGDEAGIDAVSGCRFDGDQMLPAVAHVVDVELGHATFGQAAELGDLGGLEIAQPGCGRP